MNDNYLLIPLTHDEINHMIACIDFVNREFGKSDKRNHIKNVLLNRRGGKRREGGNTDD